MKEFLTDMDLLYLINALESSQRKLICIYFLTSNQVAAVWCDGLYQICNAFFHSLVLQGFGVGRRWNALDKWRIANVVVTKLHMDCTRSSCYGKICSLSPPSLSISLELSPWRLFMPGC